MIMIGLLAGTTHLVITPVGKGDVLDFYWFIGSWNVVKLPFSFSVTFLGKLDTWNVNYAEVEEIRSEIRSCNMDLELWETFDSFDREDAMENFIRMNREMDQLGMVEQVEQ